MLRLLEEHAPHIAPALIAFGAILWIWLADLRRPPALEEMERLAEWQEAERTHRRETVAPRRVRRIVPSLLALAAIVFASSVVLYVSALTAGPRLASVMWIHVAVASALVLLALAKLRAVGRRRIRRTLRFAAPLRISTSAVTTALLVPLVATGVILTVHPRNDGFTSNLHLLVAAWWTALLAVHVLQLRRAAFRRSRQNGSRRVRPILLSAGMLPKMLRSLHSPKTDGRHVMRQATGSGRGETHSGLPAVPAWAPMVFVAAFAAQAGHMVLHVAQLLQNKIYHIYPHRGLLGPALVNNEWLHFIEVTVFWFMIMAVWFGYGRERRAAWRRESPTAYRAGVALLFVGFYHMVEHWVRIYQHLKTGVTPAPGLAGQVVDLVWFHAVINTVEVILISVFATGIKVDRDIPFLERQRSLMARTAGRLSSGTRSGWMLRGAALCTGPMLILFSDSIGPVPTHSATLTLKRLTVAHDGFSLASFVGLVGAALLIPAASGLARLGDEDSRLMQLGSVLVAIGATGLIAMMGLFLLAANVGVLAAHGPDSGYVALAQTVLNPHGYVLVLVAMTAMLAPGFLVLAGALYARKALPLWAALCISIGIVGQVGGHLGYDLVGLWDAGNLIWVVGLLPVGLAILRSARRADTSSPTPRAPLGRPDPLASAA